jgi:DNA replication licensing factor MCM7
LARLRWEEVVQRSDVDEALRLMECSKESLLDEEDEEVEVDKSAMSKIFRLIKEMAGSGNTHKRPKQPKRFGRGPGGERDMDVDDNEDDDDYDDEDDNTVLSMVEVRARVLSAGFTEAQLMETVVTVSLTSYFCSYKTDVVFASMKT